MPTGHRLVERAMRLLLDKDMGGFADLWAEDGEMEFPLAPPGYPERVQGREAVREYLRDYPEHVDVRSIASQRVHETTDPDVVIVEFEAEGIAVRTGRPYRMRYISVLTTRDGEIVSYRDYWSPLAAAAVFGGLDDLTAAFTPDASAPKAATGGDR